VSVNIVSILACFGIALLVMVPFGLLCFWASYRLGKRQRLTDEAMTIVLGIGVLPLPFAIVFMLVLIIVLHLLHLPHNGQYAPFLGVAGGIAVGGWMGAGVARLENLKENLKQQGQ
jgi:ABC-type antimicrobial peptide transport system permease subunit